MWFSRQLPLLVIHLEILGSCIGLNGSPSKDTSFGNLYDLILVKVLAEVIVKDDEKRPSWVRMGLQSNDKCLYERRKREKTQRRRPYED